MHKVFLALIIDLLYIGLAEPTGCILKDFPKTNDPLYLIESQTNFYTLLVPKPGDAVVTVDTEKSVHLACIGEGNYLVQSEESITAARCRGNDDILEINGGLHFLSSLKCKKPSFVSVEETSKSCHHGTAKLFRIGFKLPKPYNWKHMIEICYDDKTGLTYYTKHRLYSSTQFSKVHKPNRPRPRFIQGPSKFSLKAYSQERQRQVFHDLFGDKASDYFNGEDSFLSKGHLAPDADFIYPAWQLSTYYLMNVAPQWQEINGGQWSDTVENGIRGYAFRQRTDLLICSGTTGNLELDDKHGKPCKISLYELFKGKKSFLPVPEYFWKIVENPRDHTCTGVLGTNNPYLKTSPQLKCKNLCPQWASRFIGTGFVYCCSYIEMRNIIPEIPALHCQRGPLSHFPK